MQYLEERIQCKWQTNRHIWTYGSTMFMSTFVTIQAKFSAKRVKAMNARLATTQTSNQLEHLVIRDTLRKRFGFEFRALLV